MTLKLSKVIGHRGACGYAPENTIESIRTAADMGLKWVEIDVKLTKDLIPIIFHDDELDRTTNGTGLVAEKNFEDINDLEAGSWFADSFAGAKIPTLEDILDEIIKLNLGLNLEIKPCPGRDKETAEVALDYLSQYWDDHDKILISSFSYICLEAALDMASDWPRGLLFSGDHLPEDWKDLCDYLEADTVNIDDKMVNKKVIETITDYNKKVLVYTVNEAERARELQSYGAHAIFTDFPDIILDSLLTVH